MVFVAILLRKTQTMFSALRSLMAQLSQLIVIYTTLTFQIRQMTSVQSDLSTIGSLVNFFSVFITRMCRSCFTFVPLRKLSDQSLASRKHLRTKVTLDLHLTYSKNGGNLGLVLNDKK